LFRSREEKEAASKARADFDQFVALLQNGSPGQVRSAVPGLKGRAALLSGRERERLADQAVRTYSQAVLTDDVVSADEEEAFSEVCDAVGIDDETWNTKYRDVLFSLTIAKVNDGRLEAIDSPHVMTKKNEVVHLEMTASLMKEVLKREFRGGSSGVSFRIAPGVRYRVGAFRGHSVVVGSELQVADTGVLAVTSTRIVFMGGRKTMEVPFAKLVGMDGFSDGLRLHASNRQNAPLFRLESGDVVAATINAAAQRLEA
jgi:hypothetical protein